MSAHKINSPSEENDTRGQAAPKPDSTILDALDSQSAPFIPVEGEVTADPEAVAELESEATPKPEESGEKKGEQSESPVSLEDTEEEKMRITQKAIEMLKTVFDPEIPVNVYDLGLIYKIDYDPKDKMLHVDMTLTAPGCPAADFILEDVRQKLLSVEGPAGVDLRLVFEPEWDKEMMSEEARFELGF